jgi:hypothetical protein
VTTHETDATIMKAIFYVLDLRDEVNCIVKLICYTLTQFYFRQEAMPRGWTGLDKCHIEALLGQALAATFW